jgi:integrase
MARSPLPAGTFGEIAVSKVGRSYKARARYRGQDGLTRTVARFGQTKAAAQTALKVALTEQRQADATLDPNTRVGVLFDRWLAEVDTSGRLSATTKAQYHYLVDGYVRRRMGELRIAEATTGRCDAVLQSIAEHHGPSAARSVRAVLNGAFKLAVRHDAIVVNPVRETRPISVPRRMAHALEQIQVEDFTDQLRADEVAVRLDLPDLVDMALATGCRIGELLAIRESAVDLERGTVLIAATAIRPKGEPLQIQEYAKSEAGNRLLALPSYAVELLRRRQTEVRFRAGDLVFPAPTSPTIRDPSNCAGDLREVANRLGYPWLTFHTFRKTVATQLDEAGVRMREISDQLGHSQVSMTLDRYQGRKIRSTRAAKALDR